MSRHSQIAADRGRATLSLVAGAVALAGIFVTGLPGAASSAQSPTIQPTAHYQTGDKTQYGYINRHDRPGRCGRPMNPARWSAILRNRGWTGVRYRGRSVGPRLCQVNYRYTACRGHRRYTITIRLINGRYAGSRSVRSGLCLKRPLRPQVYPRPRV
jgi:hypothetical protein